MKIEIEVNDIITVRCADQELVVAFNRDFISRDCQDEKLFNLMDDLSYSVVRYLKTVVHDQQIR